MVGRGCFGVPLVLNAGRVRGRLRFAVWTGDLGFVKVGACVGLCISVAVWTAWKFVLVFTLAEEDVVERGGLFAQKPKVNLDLQKFRVTLLCL